MNRTAAASLVALAFLVAPSARAADDAEAADLRRDVEALVRRIEQGPQPDADSPTAIVNRLLAAGEPKLRPVLEEAWRIAAARSAGDDDRGESVSWLVRFLYGRVSDHEPHGSPIVGADGVVRIRPGDGQPPMMGLWLTHPPPPPTFAELVEGGKLRAPTRPWAAADLVSELPKLATDGEFSQTLDDFGRAVGEACAADATLRRRLMSLADDERLVWTIVTALAWTKAPDAVKSLCDKLPRLASAALADFGSPGPFRAACNGLVHADPAALVAAIAKLPDADQQVEAWCNVGLDFAEPYFVSWLDHAETPAERIAVLRRITAYLGDRAQMSATTSVAPMFARLLTEFDRGDEPTREAALAAVTALLGGGAGGMQRGGASGGYRYESVGERIQPYPDARVGLQTLRDDLASRRIAFGGARPGVFDADEQPATRLAADVQSGVPSPDVNFDGLPRDGGAKLRLSGAFDEGGLSLTLTNVGEGDAAIDAVALRYVSAEVAEKTVTVTGHDSKRFREMNLVFGRLPHAAVVDAKDLVTIAPGKSFSWTTPVRPQDRDVDHVAIALEYDIRVRGKPPAPLVTQFRDVWVK